jgi:hypothetical protein
MKARAELASGRERGMVRVLASMTPASAAEAPPLPVAPVKVSLRDFSDRLSPMLVKELRQGLKSPVFTWGLMAMQLSLVIMALLSMESGNTRDINSLFWWSVAGPVCVLLPMRVANALRDESSANTLDTLLLTQLSAWRITLGKWLATCALQVLVAITALPYLILRYFGGGVNTPLEIAWLGIVVLFSMVVTAVMLGLSWFPYFLIRAIIMLGVLAGAAGACGGTIEEISRGDYMLDEFYDEMAWPGVIYWLVLAFYTAFYCLDLGAARLAPMSENRATRRRLAGLAVLLVCGVCCLWRWHLNLSAGGNRENGFILSTLLGLVMLLPSVQAISERPVNLAPVLMPFLKRGWRGRVAGWFLLPGWHSGVFYALLLLFPTGVLIGWLGLKYSELVQLSYGYSHRSALDEEDMAVILQVFAGILGTIFMPLLIWRLLRRMNRWDFWRWLLLIVAAGAFHFFITPLGIKSSSKVLYANYVLPSGAFLVIPSSEAQARDEWLETETLEETLEETRNLSPAARVAMQEKRYQEYARIKDRTLREHGIISVVSCALWLALAIWMAFREMRVTARAGRELA